MLLYPVELSDQVSQASSPEEVCSFNLKHRHIINPLLRWREPGYLDFFGMQSNHKSLAECAGFEPTLPPPNGGILAVR